MRADAGDRAVVSSTMIWSACMIVPTRCATMITVASAVCLRSAARRRASVVKSSAEKLSSKIWILRLLGQRPGDGEALALPAGDAGAALGDVRLELLGHLLDELAALGDLEVAPELLVGGLLVAVAQVVGHACR